MSYSFGDTVSLNAIMTIPEWYTHTAHLQHAWIYYVDEVSSDGTKMTIQGNGYEFECDDFYLVIVPQQRRFHVGDELVAIGSYRNGRLQKGQVYTVLEEVPGTRNTDGTMNYCVLLKEIKSDGRYGEAWFKSLYPPAPIKIKRPIKINLK